ncbi:MAG: Fe-S-binding domain-containing protein, partial [Actinobacteria bacterium]|nr:Fe-S-binding domain-containing protein [Actinomycetota bacterium]
MTVDQALPLPVVFPLAGAVLSPLAARLHRRLALIVGMIALGASAAILMVIGNRVYAGNGRFVTHFFSNQRPIKGSALGIAFTADPFGLTFALLAATVGLLLMLSALSELGGLGSRELGGL